MFNSILHYFKKLPSNFLLKKASLSAVFFNIRIQPKKPLSFIKPIILLIEGNKFFHLNPLIEPYNLEYTTLLLYSLDKKYRRVYTYSRFIEGRDYFVSYNFAWYRKILLYFDKSTKNPSQDGFFVV